MKYSTFTRNLENYKWYKPILVMILTWIFTMIFAFALIAICSIRYALQNGETFSFLSMLSAGYDGFDVYSSFGAIAVLGNVVCMIPALMLASKIVKDRPFSTYVSVSGKFRKDVFLKGLGISMVTLGIPDIIYFIVSNDGTGTIRFTVLGFVICTILGPLQCMAEEFVFRGLIQQTVGAWFGISIIAIIAQTIAFGMGHPYNDIGVISVIVTGVVLGFAAEYTGGLEVSMAFHIVNNMISFYCTGFGFGKVSADVDIFSLILGMIAELLFVAGIIFFKKKKILLPE